MAWEHKETTMKTGQMPGFRMTAIALLTCASVMQLTGCSKAQGPSESAAVFIPEALPPHLQFRVDNQFNSLVTPTANEARDIINSLKRWPPSQAALRVCFFSGDVTLRRHIVAVASRWMQAPVGVAFDFGQDGGRLCGGSEQNQIRVGFRYSGFWSLVGQDSVALANQNEESLNLQYFDVAPPGEPEFTRKVLHEFGHALGFEHEHQHPYSECENEFDWPAIYAYLAGPPNRWPQDEVDRQMRRLTADQLIIAPFNVRSIMLYAFPAQFYKHGAQSPCYTTGNDDLSPGDLALLAQVYPADGQHLAQERNALVDRYVAMLNKAKPGFQQEIKAFVELQKLTEGELPKDTIASFSAAENDDSALPPELRQVKPIT
jgi:hypothetical protein